MPADMHMHMHMPPEAPPSFSSSAPAEATGWSDGVGAPIPAAAGEGSASAPPCLARGQLRTQPRGAAGFRGCDIDAFALCAIQEMGIRAPSRLPRLLLGSCLAVRWIPSGPALSALRCARGATPGRRDSDGDGAEAHPQGAHTQPGSDDYVLQAFAEYDESEIPASPMPSMLLAPCETPTNPRMAAVGAMMMTSPAGAYGDGRVGGGGGNGDDGIGGHAGGGGSSDWWQWLDVLAEGCMHLQPRADPSNRQVADGASAHIVWPPCREAVQALQQARIPRLR